MARIAKEQSGRNWEVYLDEPTYQQFRRKAAALINRETCWLSAQGDDLLQEVMLRLLQSGDNFSCSGPDHFRATVPLRISHVLIDMVRAIKAAKRGRGFQRVPLDDNTRSESGSVSQNLIIGQSFYRLGVRDARLRRVLELRMAGNAPLDEIAAELSVSEARLGKSK